MQTENQNQTPPSDFCEDEMERLRVNALAISNTYLDGIRLKTLSQQEAALKYIDGLFGNPTDVEALELLRGVRLVAENPRYAAGQVMAGVSEGIYPYQGFTRGVTRSMYPQLSQIPKTPESRKLIRERMEATGQYIPKRGSDAELMFICDSYPSVTMGEMGRIFEHEMYHAQTYIAQGQSCGKSTSMQHLMDYHHRAQEQIYAGPPGRPKSNKVKRKAQKAARKAARKGNR